MSYFTVSNQEWLEAEHFFSKPKNQDKKFRRQDRTLYQKSKESIHSFIKINNEIYALHANTYLGSGTFGNVKIAQNKKGETFALKIEGRELRNENDPSLRAMKKVGYYFGQFERPLGKTIYFKDELTRHKLYTLTKLREGTQLYDALLENDFSRTQRLILAIKCCLSIQKLHNKRIIHGDIKPENFIANINGQDISVKTIDFDFSLILDKGALFFEHTEAMGTPDYVAPEIITDFHFSYASDIFALGNLFKNDLKLSSKIYAEMLNENRRHRPSMITIIDKLNQELKKQPNLEQAAIQLIKQVDLYHLPNHEPKIAEKYTQHLNSKNKGYLC
jgi:serine/threonine protein kinase